MGLPSVQEICDKSGVSQRLGIDIEHQHYLVSQISQTKTMKQSSFIWFGLLEITVSFVTVTDISRQCQPEKLIPLLL